MKTVARALVLLLSSTLASVAGEPDWVEARVGDLGVILPTGGGWEMSQTETGAWISVRLQRNATGVPVYLHGIAMERHQVPGIYSDWLPVELATDYLLWEIENMQTRGVAKGEYALDALDVYQERHGTWDLHVLRNVKAYIKPRYPMLELEAQELYLVFLPDFPETTTFYKVYLNADCFFAGCTAADLDLGEMTPLLDDLRDYSAASD